MQRPMWKRSGHLGIDRKYRKAKYHIRTPDSIQLATGIIHGAETFITNDLALKKINEIKIIVLDDYI